MGPYIWAHVQRALLYDSLLKTSQSSVDGREKRQENVLPVLSRSGEMATCLFTEDMSSKLHGNREGVPSFTICPLSMVNTQYTLLELNKEQNEEGVKTHSGVFCSKRTWALFSWFPQSELTDKWRPLFKAYPTAAFKMTSGKMIKLFKQITHKFTLTSKSKSWYFYFKMSFNNFIII